MMNRFVPREDVQKILLHIIGNSGDIWQNIKNPHPITEEAFLSDLNIPIENRDKDGHDHIALICPLDDVRLLKVNQLLGTTKCTNAIAYAPGSVMGWHTNSDTVGTRVYYTYTLKKGIFRYRDPHTLTIINDYDDSGWTGRNFVIDKDLPLWHTVWSEGIRFSFGFNIEHER